MAFPKQNTCNCGSYRSFFLIDIDLNSVLTRQTPVKIAYKPGLEYLLECFLPSTFARIISVLPEKFQNFLAPPSRPPARKPMFKYTGWFWYIGIYIIYFCMYDNTKFPFNLLLKILQVHLEFCVIRHNTLIIY